MSFPIEFARRLGSNAARAARQTLSRSLFPRGPGTWLLLRLAPPLEEERQPTLPFSRESHPSLLEVLLTLHTAGEDPNVDGVVLRLAGAPHGWAKVMAVRRAVQGVRARGKAVVVYAEQLGMEDYFLASAATRIWLPESGALLLVGLRSEGLFLHGLLKRLGIKPDVLRVGGFKTAADMLLRESMSPEQREQAESLLDDLYANVVEGIAGGRKMSAEAVRACIDGGPYTATAARDAGLVDACLYPDEVEEALGELSRRAAGGDDSKPEVRLINGSAYTALRAKDPGWRPLLGDLPRVAYVVASGGIHRGRGIRGIASDNLRALLERLRKDPGIRGIVLRIVSPGGDSLASDLVWRAVRVTRRDKPVVVSMGDVAASGGYYIAAAADAILAEAATVTGSIGVIGGKVDLQELYRRIGVAKDGIERGARAGLLSDDRGFNPDERAAMRKQLESVYAAFVSRVADGRGLEQEQVERLARGRVWSGARAHGLGLVDALGGPFEALIEVRRRAGLADDARIVLETYPRRPRLSSLRAWIRPWGGSLGI